MVKHHELNLAVIQVGGINTNDSKEAVVRRLIGLLETAAERGAELAVFPELTLTTFFPRTWFEDEKQVEDYFEAKMPNQTVQPLFDRARELRCGFYLGYAELTEEGRRFNTSILVDRDGQIIGKYRKMHLPGHADNRTEEPNQHLEKKYFEEGDLGFGVFDFHGINVGMCLCNDRRWPEVYRAMALQSAEVVLLGYNTPDHVPGWPEEPHAKMFTHLLSIQAGAYQNAIFVAAAGKSGWEDGVHMIGGSAIAAPSGEILTKAAGEGDEVITYPIRLNQAEPYREGVFNFSAHRRPDAYNILVDRKGRGEPLPTPSLQDRTHA